MFWGGGWFHSFSHSSIFSDSLFTNDKLGVHWINECLQGLTPATHIPNHALFSHYTVEMFKDIGFTHVFHGRKAIYYGPVSYSYGRTYHAAKPVPTFPSPVHEIYKLTNTVFANHFNSLMIHYYENGDSYIPSHADDEPGIAVNSVILSISFGQSRMFVVSSKTDPSARFKYRLKHGDILLMSHHSQEHFNHEINPSTSSMSARVSLTFRQMCVPWFLSKQFCLFYFFALV